MYAGRVNFTSLLFMYVYRIYLSLLFVLYKKGENIFMSLCLLILLFDKKEEKIVFVYLCPVVDFILTKWGSRLFLSLCLPLCWWIDKKGERNLEIYICMFSLCMFTFVYFYHWYIDFTIDIRAIDIMYVYLCMFMHIYIEHSLHIFIVYCYAWVKGKLLWSLTLIHAYITPWVLSSSKRERLLAQRPFTLVLMMTKLMELYMHGLKLSFIEPPI